MMEEEVVVVRVVSLVAGLAAALVLAGCGGGARQAAQPPVAQPQPVAPAVAGQKAKVRMSEFAFAMEPAEVQAGTVTFEVENAGAVEHSFVIEQAGVRSEQIRPGQEVALRAELAPGTYTVICDVAGHKEAGMQTQLVVK